MSSNPNPYEWTDDEIRRLFGGIDGWVDIHVQGFDYQVPEGLELLRCFQYLRFDIDYDRFCWNASCDNCRMKVIKESGKKLPTLACQFQVFDSISIEELPVGIKAKAPPAGAGEAKGPAEAV